MKTFLVKHAYSDKVCQAVVISDPISITFLTSVIYEFPSDSIFVLGIESVTNHILCAYSPEQMSEFKTNWQIVVE